MFAALFIHQSLTAQEREDVIRVDTDLVLINVLVTGKTGQAVTGLKSEQFELYVDGKKQPIENSAPQDGAISYGIVYDMHPASEERTKAIIDSLNRFKNSMGSNDDLFMVAFNMHGREVFDFVPTVDQLVKHMAAPSKREPRSLYDAVYFASEKIRTRPNRKKVLLIISDSADHQSRHKLSDLERDLAELRAEVYAVIPDNDNGFGYADMARHSQNTQGVSSDASALDRAALMDLTLKNGGGTYLGGAGSSAQLFNIYSKIEEEVRSSYTLGFYPGSKDRLQHEVRIRLRGVKGGKDLVLTYRMDYRIGNK